MVCPSCARPMNPSQDLSYQPARLIWICIPCGEVKERDNGLNTPNLGNVARKSTPDDRAERLIQARIIQVLESHGFTVLETGARNARGSGNTVGCPDLIAGKQNGRLFALEVKTAKGRIRPEQQRLVDMGLVSIVRNEAQALEAVGLRNV